MTALVRSELHKIRTTRLWWGLLIGALLYSVVLAAANAALAGLDTGTGTVPSAALDTAEAIRTVYASSPFRGSYIFAMILGITAMTGEYRYQTVTATFLATPRRVRVVLAKMAAHLAVGLGYGLLSVPGALVVGGIIVRGRGYDLGLAADGLWRSIGLAVLAVGLWTLLGIGIGTLIRNQVTAILVAVFVTFLIEPLATFLAATNGLEAVVRWLPTNASTALTSPDTALLDYLTWWAGGLVLLTYAAALAGLGVLLSVRRDVT